MSSDLLAEFDSFYRAPNSGPVDAKPASNDLSFLADTSQNVKTQKSAGASKWQQLSSQSGQTTWPSMSAYTGGPVQKQVPVEDDIWGSFETDLINTPAKKANTHAASGGVEGLNTIQNKPEILRRSTLDMFSQNATGRPEPQSHSIPVYTPQNTAKPVSNNNAYGDILFDAMDELTAEPEDDDDFGDFETGSSSGPPQTVRQSQPSDLILDAAALIPKPVGPSSQISSLSISSPTTGLPYPQAPKSPSFQERNPFSDLGLATKRVNNVEKDDQQYSASPVTAWPTFKPSVPKPAPYMDSPVPPPVQIEDDWGDFEDLPSTKPTTTSTYSATGFEEEARSWDAADRVISEPLSSQNVPPPTNVPPPSILLALFPPLFALPQTSLFHPISTQPSNIKPQILTSPSTIAFLKSYLLIASVSARIIAGRKLRWKRDTVLSQSMKIGPASTGGKSGMKLTGVDKAEMAKEDREVADIIQVWRDQLGRLRSAVAVANSSISDARSHLVIPEIGENMPIQTFNGALTAPKSCIICGLKREERVRKVDLVVEDSFGEWWVDYWGHRACRNFWLEHERNLKH